MTSRKIAMPLGARSLRNLFSRPATRRYPREVRPRIAGTRGHVSIDLAACTFCEFCARLCPTGALALDPQQRTLAIEHLRCIACGSCVEVCSPKSLTMSEAPLAPFGREEAGPQGRSPGARQIARQAVPPPAPAPTGQGS